jgi:hypothetical protein
MKSMKQDIYSLKSSKKEKLRDASLEKSAPKKSGSRVYSGNSGGTRKA